MSKKRILLLIITCVLALVLIGVIFWLSNQPAEESAEMSNTLIAKIYRLLGVFLPEVVVRKLAHFCEFLLLAFLYSNIFYLIKAKKWYVPAFSLAVLYAVTDEIHQLFIPGRAGMVIDVFIDALGTASGIAIYFLIIKIIHSVRRKKNVRNTSV
ncbi:MAG: VanZ family protein [Clostridiales bacterium]|nr:VanZ family protein [Clostridiales bacterium]